MRLPSLRPLIISLVALALALPALANTLTPNKGFNQPAVNGDNNIWGTLLNNNAAALDNNLGGNVTVSSLTGGTVVATATNAGKLVQTLTGTLVSPLVYELPQVGSFYIINNQTTGAFSTTVITTAGGSTGIVVPQGTSAMLWSDSVNIYALSPAPGITLTGATLSGTTTNSGTISGGTISGATLSGTTTNSGTISGGTISAPALSGTVTGTYTLGGTPTIGAATLSGTLAATGQTISAPTISGATLSGTTTLPDSGTIASGGTVLGTATGGAKGAGTLNAQNLYVNGTAVPTAAPVFTASFTSSQQALGSSGSLITVAHSLGGVPFGVMLEIVNQTGELGYSPGDIVVINANIDQEITNATGVGTWIDATNVNVIWGGSSTLFITPKTTFAGVAAITPADWKLVVKAWR